MRACHGSIQYEMPQEWWDAAGMAGFKPRRRAYRADTSTYPGLDILELPTADIRPVDRKLSHGVFNDSGVSGLARDRVIQILSGFRDDSAIPPVQVLRLNDGQHRYQLSHGAHRFCCAVIAGFQAVPAVDVTDVCFSTMDVDLDA